jgi:hypothetical protein
MATSTSERAIRFILRETIGELLYFPVWWYSIGLVTFIKTLGREWLTITDRLAIRILAKNMLRPMYADYSRPGRVISFVFRVLILGVRLVVLCLWSAVELVLILAWLFGPLVAAALLIRQAVPI